LDLGANAAIALDYSGAAIAPNMSTLTIRAVVLQQVSPNLISNAIKHHD